MIPFIVITMATTFLNWICEKVLFKDGYPMFLSISGTINTSDLLIGVFTAQVAMVTIAIAFSGLLIQLFNSSEKYLGMSLREVILSRPHCGISLVSLMGTSLFLSILSYYYVAQHHVVGVISLFIANIIIVFVVFRYYILNAMFTDSTKQYIRDETVQVFIQTVDVENDKIEVLLK